ncbi:unnamed protein product, partial [Ectocarpus fasciculatus]
GSTPPELGALNNLRTLELSINSLTGTFFLRLIRTGSIDEARKCVGGTDFSNLCRSLKLLTCGCTAVLIWAGPIPKELGDLTELKELRMLCNNLTGHIPPQLGYLSVLWELDLSFNKLDG